MTKTAAVLLPLLLLLSLRAESYDSLAVHLPDSLQNTDTTQVDSTQMVKKEVSKLQPIWIDSKNGLVNSLADSIEDLLFHQKDILYLNYNGLSDLLRNYPEYQAYDMMDMGIPRYISNTNFLPHQSAVRYNGQRVNDPLHGMYNTRYLPADIVEAVERDDIFLDETSLTSALNISGRQILPYEPYTRIMFRQGDYGYTDLDITFAKKMSNRFAFQLGGLNKYYDPSGYRGVNFRGTLHYAFSPRLTAISRFNLNREKLNIYPDSEYSSYKHNEARDDIHTELIYASNKEKDEFWHFDLLYSGSERTNTITVDSVNYKLKNHYNRLSLSASHNWHLAGMEFFSRLALNQTKIWGLAYEADYVDRILVGQSSVKMPLLKALNLQAGINYSYLWDEDMLCSPFAVLGWAGGKINTEFIVKYNQRRANFSERYFNFAGFKGAENLQPEQMLFAEGRFRYTFFEGFSLLTAMGAAQIENEISLRSNNFEADEKRTVTFGNGKLGYSFYKFNIALGGQLNISDLNIAPKTAFWSELRFNDTWLSGAIIFDAIASVYWKGKHNQIFYNPLVERFHWGDHVVDGYNYFTLKAVATVQGAQFFLALDNPLADEYQFIEGYPEFSRRIQFGLNWVMWD